ncbi:MAG: hypothetical protein ACQR33_05950 [Candidatus Saccharibacteria bacterium]
MPHDVFLIAMLGLPVIALTVLRINAVMVFLSLCLGEVLVRFVATEANTMLTLFAPHASSIGGSTIQIAVLLLPAVLTSIFMVFSIRGRGKLLFNVLPALGVGSLTALMVVPLLPIGTQHAIETQSLWDQLAKLQALIVSASAVVSLLFLWAQRRKAVAKGED